MTDSSTFDTIVAMDVLTLPSQIAGSWLQQEQLATSMSRFPNHARSRSSWRGQHERVLVRLHTRDGRAGIGATRGTAAATVLVDHLSHLLRGRRVSDHATLYDELVGAQLTYGHSGVGAAAVSAVDLALWDLRAQIAELPLCHLLNSSATQSSLSCYTTIHPDNDSNVAAFQGVKLAARYGPHDGSDAVDRQVRDVQLVRQKVSPETLVMVDAACGWTLDFTQRFLDRLGEPGVDWLEDPLLPSDRSGYESLATRLHGTSTQLCLGNYDFSEEDGQRTLSDGYVTVYQPDLTWVGGLTAAQRLWQRARDAGMSVSPHYGAMHPWSTHLIAASPGAALTEYIPAALQDGRRTDFPALPLPFDGIQHVPTDAGASAAVPPAVFDSEHTRSLHF